MSSFRVGARAGTQLIEVRNKTLTTCDLESLLPLRYGAFYVQPGGLVPRARGRIYVAFGEHPAAGGLFMFFVSSWHFARPCGVSLTLWLPFGSIVTPWASILTHMGYSWEAFRHFGETVGLHFCTLGLHLGTLGVHVGVLWALLGVALDPSGHFCGKC